MLAKRGIGPAAHRFAAAFAILFVGVAASHAQEEAATDPRQSAYDLYTGLVRDHPKSTVALKLGEFIRLYGHDCNYVSAYQVFSKPSNIFHLKAKCPSLQTFGVTVAANGYGSVYGGNGIVGSLDARDGLITSFDAGGNVVESSALNAADIVKTTGERLGTQESGQLLLLILSVAGVVAFALGAAGLFVAGLRRHRKRKGRRRHAVSPMGEMASEKKNRLVEEATPLSERMFHHPCGVYIAVGPRGKRRFFGSRLWAWLYMRYGWRLFEVLRVPDDCVAS